MDLAVPDTNVSDLNLMRTVENVEAKNSTTRTQRSFWAKFVVYIGAHEFFSPEMWRAALTELVATAFLVFTLSCSIISCLDSHISDPKFIIPLFVFIIAFLFLTVMIPLTGGHMSPVFTLIFTLRGRVTLSRALAYVTAQCLGSILGYVVIKIVMNRHDAERYSLGGCSVATHDGALGIRADTALVLEFACTFIVLLIGVTVALDPRRCKELGLVTVCAVVAGSMGLAVFVSISVTGRPGYAGVGLNPARCLGPALLVGGELWNGHWVFWVGPFLACSVYYGLNLNLPREGLGSIDRDIDYDIVKLTGSCFGGSGQFPNSERQN